MFTYANLCCVQLDFQAASFIHMLQDCLVWRVKKEIWLPTEAQLEQHRVLDGLFKELWVFFETTSKLNQESSLEGKLTREPEPTVSEGFPSLSL